MTLRFEDEQYVRIYPKQTATYHKLGWEGRVVLHELFLHLDRLGVFSCSEDDPVAAASLVTEIPPDIVRVGLKRAIQQKCLVYIDQDGGYLFAPRFREAQEARYSNRLLCKRKRERAVAAARWAELCEDPTIAARLKTVAANMPTQNDPGRVGGDPGQVASEKPGDPGRVGSDPNRS